MSAQRPAPATATAGLAVVHLVRHADAMARARWPEGDDRRPLTRRGLDQAEALAGRLAGCGARAVISSPALRCLTTVAPLARELALGVEAVPFLAEGTPAEPALAGLLARTAGGTVVACTHGDVLGEVLDALARRGTTFRSSRLLPKAGTWELFVQGGEVSEARLVPAPAV